MEFQAGEQEDVLAGVLRHKPNRRAAPVLELARLPVLLDQAVDLSPRVTAQPVEVLSENPSIRPSQGQVPESDQSPPRPGVALRLRGDPDPDGAGNLEKAPNLLQSRQL